MKQTVMEFLIPLILGLLFGFEYSFSRDELDNPQLSK